MPADPAGRADPVELLHPDARELARIELAETGPRGYQLPVAEARANFERLMVEQGRDAGGLEIEELQVPAETGPVRLRRYRPEDGQSEGGVLFIHGGGFLMGTIESHDSLVRDLALATRAQFFSVAYDLAPEARFPVALEQCVAAFEWLAEHSADLDFDAASLALCGDSAGANLALAVAVVAGGQKGPVPAALGLFYPIVTANLELGFDPFFDGIALREEEVRHDIAHYMPEGKDPGEEPLFELISADLSKLPPTIAAAAACDPLHDQGRLLGEEIEDQGGECSVRVFDGMPHGFAQLPKLFDAADEAIGWVADGLRMRLGSDAARGVVR